MGSKTRERMTDYFLRPLRCLRHVQARLRIVFAVLPTSSLDVLGFGIAICWTVVRLIEHVPSSYPEAFLPFWI